MATKDRASVRAGDARRGGRTFAVVLAVALAGVSAGGCKRLFGGSASDHPRRSDGGGAGADPGAGTSTGTSIGTLTLASAMPIGMLDPFARLSGPLARSLRAGYSALRARKYDEAAARFHEVVAAAPDYTVARHQEIRALALGGHAAEVPPLWAALLARDAVAYAGRLDEARELQPFRATPAYAAARALEAPLRARYSEHLDQGFFFVARTRDAAAPKFSAGSARLEPRQEVFHFDPSSGVYRRLSETDGHVLGINLSPDRRTLTFVAASRAEQGKGGALSLSGVQAGFVDLASLDRVGPFSIKPSAGTVALYFSARGEPLFTASPAPTVEPPAGSPAVAGSAAPLPVTYAVDAARTTLVPITTDPAAMGEHVTWVSLNTVSHAGARTVGAHIADDGLSIELDGGARPLRSARPLGETTLEWSPDHKRLVYAGVLDACAVLGASKGAPADKNELYLYDSEKQLATRVAQGISAFDTIWLDDDHLVYEGGVGRDGQLHVYQPSNRGDVVVRTVYGAGLFGYPNLACDTPPEEVPTDEPIEEVEVIPAN